MSETEWPAADIETVGCCPVCLGTERDLAFSGLQDRIFFAAPGKWTMWRCLGCDVAYLDPRPTVGSIGRAYSTYYTHGQDIPDHSDSAKRSFVQKLKRYAMNDFLNVRFGYRLRPALPGGHFAFSRRPDKALQAEEMARHLPAPKPGDKMVDIGCGNGAFALLARDRLGYQAEGTEFDLTGTARAIERGLLVHQAPIPGMGLAEGAYEQVTMSHVLEHIHDPMAALREVYRILKPGGRVWIQVPNLDGKSIKKFGADSRLLEPPRHLVMFTQTALRTCLEQAEFVDVASLPRENNSIEMFTLSWMIANRIDPYGTNRPVVPDDVMLAAVKARDDFDGVGDGAEFLTMVGFRA